MTTTKSLNYSSLCRPLGGIETRHSSIQRVGALALGIFALISAIFLNQAARWTSLSVGVVLLSTGSLVKQVELSIDPEKLANTLDANSDTIQAHRSNEEVSSFNRRGTTFVFTLKSYPDLIFKIASPREIKERYDQIQKGQKLCKAHSLDRLVIPHTELVTTTVGGKRTKILVQKHLQFNRYPSAQKELALNHIDDQLIEQLTLFVCKMGYRDIHFSHTPLLPSGQQIALINLKPTGVDNGLQQVVQLCNTQAQYDLMVSTAGVTEEFLPLWEQRCKELAKIEALKQWHRERGVIQGDEPISCPENASEETRSLVAEINRQIAESPREKSIIGRRSIYISNVTDEQKIALDAIKGLFFEDPLFLRKGVRIHA